MVSKKDIVPHFCHAEPFEACPDIKHLHSPFDGLRVTVVTFYEFIKIVLTFKAELFMIFTTKIHRTIKTVRTGLLIETYSSVDGKDISWDV